MRLKYVLPIKILLDIPLLSPAFVSTLLNLLNILGFSLLYSSHPYYFQVILQFFAVVLGFLLALALSSDTKFVYKLLIDPTTVNSLICSRRDISRFNLVFFLIQAIVVINLIVNGNFFSFDSSARFVAVKVPFLHNISLYLSSLLAFLLFISPLKSWRGMFLSPCWVFSNSFFILSFFAAPSKGLLLQLLTKYLFIYSFRFRRDFNLTFSFVLHFLRTFKFRKLFLSFLFLLGSTFFASALFAIFSGGSLELFVFRLLNGFDQLSLLDKDTINIVIDSTSPIYPFVWLKSFIRPIFSSIYDPRFDNYTEHMQYIKFGLSTTSYEQSNWAPNNLLFVDSILNFPSSVVLQFFNSFILTIVYILLSLKALKFIFFEKFFFQTTNYVFLFPLAAMFFAGPTTFMQDTQASVTFIVVSIVFSAIYFIFSVMFRTRHDV